MFVRKPERAALQKPGLAQLRIRLNAKAPVIGIPEIARETRHFPEDARALFLSEGYVYSEEPDVATVLVDTLTLGRLFKEPKIFLARNEKRFMPSQSETRFLILYKTCKIVSHLMIFEIHLPSYPLSQFIHSFVYYRDYNPSHSVDGFLPDGNVNVVLDLTDYPKYIYDNDTLKEIQTCRNVWFSGIRNKYITIPSGRDSEMFILNFQKRKSYPFSDMPLYELTDSVVDGELVLTREIHSLRARLQDTPDIKQ